MQSGRPAIAAIEYCLFGEAVCAQLKRHRRRQRCRDHRGVRLLRLDRRLRAVGFNITTFGVSDETAETANRDGRLRPAP
jgi:hypothetical protein